MSFSVYKPLVAASCIEHCAKGHITSAKDVNLVVAKTSRLEIYTIRVPEGETAKSAVLELVTAKCLFGNIESLGVVRLPASPRDSVLVAFKDAKLSIIEWDPAKHDLRTVSMHYFEEDLDIVEVLNVSTLLRRNLKEKESNENGYSRFRANPLVRTDLQQRCAVMHFCDQKLAIVPFVNVASIDPLRTAPSSVPVGPSGALLLPSSAGNVTASLGSSMSASTGAFFPPDAAISESEFRSGRLQSYSVLLKDLGVEHLKDMVFLHGYYDPTLLILHEPKRTWAGRLATRRDTCVIVAVSLNLHSQQHPRVWSVDRIPSDAFRLIPLPLSKGGGVLVISPNSVMYFNQNARYGISVNEFSSPLDLEPPYHLEESPVVVELDLCQTAFLAEDRILFSLKNGELYVLHVQSDGRTVQSLDFAKAINSVLTSCVTTLSNDLLFLGSRLGDSILIHYEEKDDSAAEKADVKPAVGANDNSNSNKRKSEPSFEENGDRFDELDAIFSGDASGNLVKKMKNEHNDDSFLAAEPASSSQQSRAFDFDDELIFGNAQNNESAKGRKLKAYTFTVCDSLANIGPISSMSVGESLDNASQSIRNHSEQSAARQVELVTCSGYGKNGSLCVLQQGVRPDIFYGLPLPGVRGIWALAGGSDSKDVHSYLILSRVSSLPTPEDKREKSATNETLSTEPAQEQARENKSAGSSLMLRVTPELEFEEITVPKMGLYSAGLTIAAGNVYDGARIVQVYATGVRLLDGVRCVQELQQEQFDSAIVFASVLDPYVLLLLENGSVVLLTATSPSHDLLQPHEPEFQEHNKITSCCVFRVPAQSGPFSLGSLPESDSAAPASASGYTGGGLQTGNHDELDDIYATKPVEPVVVKSDPENASNAPNPSAFHRQKEKGTGPTETEAVFCALSRESGCFEIRSVPDMAIVFFAQHLNKAPQIISHDAEHVANKNAASDPNPVVELCVSTMGSRNNTAFVFAFTRQEELLVYKAFHCHPSSASSLPMRLAKHHHNFVTRKLNAITTNAVPAEPTAKELDRPRHVPRLFAFQGLLPQSHTSTGSGVFIAGSRPLFATLEREYLAIHPMQFDGHVECFTMFSAQQFPNGYTNSHDQLKICQLPPRLVFDHTSQWPLLKLTLRDENVHRPNKQLAHTCTAHHISYDAVNKVYAVLCSQLAVVTTTTVIDTNAPETSESSKLEAELAQQPQPVPQGGASGTLTTEERKRSARSVPLLEPVYELRLYSALNWKCLDRFWFDENEHATSLSMVDMRDPNNPQKRTPYLAVATGTHQGEDLQVKGRMLLFEIIKLGQLDQQENAKLNCVHKKEVKAPITAIAPLDGHLCAGVGPKINVFTLMPGEGLTSIAFFDAQMYVVSMNVIKTFILCGDAYKSIFFLRWRNQGHQLTLLSKDYIHNQVHNTEFLIDNEKLAFVMTDADRNMHVYQFAPADIEARGGQMLLCKAQFHLGARVGGMQRVRLQSLHPKPVPRFGCIIGTLDGGIGALIPVEESMFKRLFALQNRMVHQLPHLAGLNPKAFRLYKPKFGVPRTNSRQIIDGELLWRFVSLDASKQKELSKQIGSTVEQIIDNLQQLDLNVNFF